ncbi:MAG: F0F1 ATP synthase subunit C [Rickettsiales bacterium]|jgi:F-type H+-transporting ATPase subunit c|nr:F0F1 ATP synthase subunit C [Rickettsiales bacterium]
MDMTLVAVASIMAAGFAVTVGGIMPTMAEGAAVRQALQSMAQQPDEAGNLRNTLFVCLAMLESCAIYALLVAMILIFSNPFWNYAVAQAAK